MIGTAGVIEVTGLAATLALLAPFAVLAVVVARLRRASRPRQSETRTAETPREAPPRDVAALPQPRRTPPPPAEQADWPARIGKAEAAGDHAALAGLYLALARTEIAEGRSEHASEHLRASVRAAAKARDAAAQAEARLELAELARAAGDLTTACEHWQIARALFYDLHQQASLSKTEALMQQHGCPTDWVLNDF